MEEIKLTDEQEKVELQTTINEDSIEEMIDKGVVIENVSDEN